MNNRKWLWIIGIIAALAIIGSIVGDRDELEADTTIGETATPEQAETPAEPRPSIGKERSDFQWHYEMTEDVEFEEGVTDKGLEVVEGTGEDVYHQTVEDQRISRIVHSPISHLTLDT